VSKREDVRRLGDMALNHFGRVDTWINNAGVSTYATFEKLDEEEIRRIMDVNFMGTVYGMQTALAIMRSQGGGTIINTASVTGKRAIPLQSVYSASKYAIVGLGEAVRAELANEQAEINVCTICPPSVDTPFFDHALTKEGVAPKPMAPVYDPEDVAEAMISCAENPQREILIGSAGKLFAIINTLAPAITDWFLGKVAVSGQLTDEPKQADAVNNLFDVPADRRERGGWTAMGTRAGANGSGGGNLITQYPMVTSIAGVAALILAARFLLR
jgi:short-subunit dehydrogenase